MLLLPTATVENGETVCLLTHFGRLGYVEVDPYS